MTELTAIDREVLQLITKFEGACELDMRDAMHQVDARVLLGEVAEYDVPGVPLADDTVSLIAQLYRALPPVPDEGWRSYVAALAHEAGRLLLAAGVRA